MLDISTFNPLALYPTAVEVIDPELLKDCTVEPTLMPVALSAPVMTSIEPVLIIVFASSTLIPVALFTKVDTVIVPELIKF